MSCPTCSHTMHNVTEVTFWCPRCGTIKVGGQEINIPEGEPYVPKLVDRCQEFRKKNPAGIFEIVHVNDAWRITGIEEAIR